jgi:hypothetical protein
MRKLKLVCGIVCDDIRREDNGKEIIIGVYSGSIVVPQFPATLLLSLWVGLEAPRAQSPSPL